MRIMLLFIGLWSGVVMAGDIEEPKWELLQELDGVELRYYEPSIQARTTLADSGQTGEGFRRLAGFIFGGNDESRKIAMTAPVLETLEHEQPIMAFTMPSAYSLEDLPQPADPRVSLTEVPGKTVAVIRFSGWATGSRVQSKTRKLLSTLKSQGIELIGVASLNQYNPPWTLPFLRRNEIMVEVGLPEDVVAATSG